MEPRGEASVIDLGLARELPDAERERPGGDRPPFWSRFVPRRWASAGCVALVLLAVAGSAPAHPSLYLVDHQPPAGATGYTVAGDRLYVLTGDSGSTLSAYRLADGRRLWSAPAAPAEFLFARPAGGTVLVVSGQAQGGCCDVTAYDRADGEARWSRRAGVVGFGADDAVVALAVEDATQLVDVQSGRVRWAGGESAIGQLSGAGSIFLTYADGTAERRDMNTGEVQASGRVHPRDARLVTQAIVDGQLAVSYTHDFQSSTVAAYKVDNLEPLWRRVDNLVEGLGPCGPLVCLSAGRDIVAVDPSTGSVRWRQSGWYGLEQGNRLLAFSPEEGRLQAVGVVDPRTGRVLLDLRSWEAHLSNNRDPRQVVLTRAAPATGRTTVAVADLAELTVDVVGVIPSLVTDCQAGDAHLACRTARGGELRLWAYRR